MLFRRTALIRFVHHCITNVCGRRTVGVQLISVECGVSTQELKGWGSISIKKWFWSIHADSTQERSYQVRLGSLSGKASWRRGGKEADLLGGLWA